MRPESTFLTLTARKTLIPLTYLENFLLVRNSFNSLTLSFLLDPRFLGDFRRLDLNESLVGSLTIQDGGTIAHD